MMLIVIIAVNMSLLSERILAEVFMSRISSCYLILQCEELHYHCLAYLFPTAATANVARNTILLAANSERSNRAVSGETGYLCTIRRWILRTIPESP